MTSTDNPSVIFVDSQALIKSYNRNIRVVLVITGAFYGFVLYGFSYWGFSMLWVVVVLYAFLLLLAFACSFLLRSVFVDKSIETLLRKKHNA